jgi:hypothetical protein
MKTSPIRLGDDEAVEPDRGQVREAPKASRVTSSNTSPFCCCWSRSTSASGRRRASLPRCILICSSQTLARLKCRLFSVDWHAARAAADSFDWSPSHQMNAACRPARRTELDVPAPVLSKVQPSLQRGKVRSCSCCSFGSVSAAASISARGRRLLIPRVAHL